MSVDLRGSRWRGQVSHEGRRIYVGTFATREEAEKAVMATRRDLFEATGRVYAGCPAIYCGRLGTIVRIDDTRTDECRNIWWREPGAGELMFTLRRDGVWRMFPGPADGPGLGFLDRLP